MIKPSINEILNKIDNRYYLIGTVSKRAREIVDGDDLLIMNRTNENKPVCLAAKEIAEGKVHYRLLTEEEIEIQEADAKKAQVVQEQE